jgi:hypothetical protein
MAEGVYSNLAMIAHSNSEFVIDFIRLMPGVPKAKVKARVIITPEHAKRLLDGPQGQHPQVRGYLRCHQADRRRVQLPDEFGGPVGEA